MLHKIVKMKAGWYVKVPFYFTNMDMCRHRFEPVSIFMLLAGAGMSAYSSIQAGKRADEIGEAKKRQFEGEASAEVLAGAEAAALKRKEGRELLASQIATVSATGGGLVGSNLVVMAESARNVETDALTIERNAQTRAKALRTRGEFARHEGQLARRNARIRATAEGVRTGAQLYGMYKYPQTTKTTSKPFTQPLYRTH